jgi:hypothetical protein
MKRLAILLLTIVACESVDADKAQHFADEYAVKHFGSDATADCVRADTDRDGYVSCTVFVHGREPEQIQCGAEKWCVANCAEGCKFVPTVKLNGPQTRRAQ